MKKSIRIACLLIAFSLACLCSLANAHSDMPRVEYTGRQTLFVFTPESTDLFAAFKELMPGDTVEQRIRVSNSSNEQIRMYLRAESVDDSDSEFLSFFNLTVTSERSEIFNAPANMQGELESDVLLGEMAPDSEMILELMLHASVELGNDFQAQAGAVRWVFTIVEVADDPTPSPTPVVPSPTPIEPSPTPDEPDPTPSLPTEAPVVPTAAPSEQPSAPPAPPTGTAELAGIGIAALSSGACILLFRKRKA